MSTMATRTEMTPASDLELIDRFVAGRDEVVAKAKVVIAAFVVATAVTTVGLTAPFKAEAPVPEVHIEPAPVKDPITFLVPPAPLMRPHDEQILALALSPDGKRLVTAGARYTLPGQFMIWDVDN